MRRRRLLLAAAALPLAAATPPASAAAPLKVVASISVLGDMVRNVGGDRVQVATLVGPDGDPHAFEPRPADAKALATADLVVVNGLALEGWLDRLVKASGYKGSVVTAAESVRPREMDEGGKTVPDPHAWQDLANGETYVRNIAAGLEAADPAGKADYERNAQAYLARLGAEDAKVRDEIARVPEAKRKVVTSHDAFGYFGAAYGVEFAAPEGISEDAEPSAADMRRLIEQNPARAHQGPVLRERAQPEAGAADRPRDRGAGRRHALRRRALEAGRPGRHLPRHVRAQRPAARPGDAGRRRVVTAASDAVIVRALPTTLG